MLRWRSVSAALLTAALLFPFAPAGADEAAGWYRVEYANRIQPADRAALAELGAEAVQYSHPDEYVAWLPAGAADILRVGGAVSAVGGIEPADKVDDRLAGRSGVVRIDVVAHAPGRQAVRSLLSSVGTVVSDYPAAADGSLAGVLADIPAGAVTRIASHPRVLHVGEGSLGLLPEGEASGQVLAGALNPDDPGAVTGPGYREFLDGLGLNGEGVTVSIVDTGVDDGHPDLAGRMADRIDYSRLPTGEPWDTGGHGTHVAGIAVGGGGQLPAVGTPTDEDGFQYGLGIAPAASYLDQPAISTTRQSFPPPGGFEAITRAAVQAGAVTWNASWTDGGGAGAGYVNNARTMDMLVRDADFDTPGNQPFSLVFSAGNSGANGLTSPKEAKNIIAVGASMSPYAGAVNRMASFSSRGPAKDGRVAPTVAAPGAAVAAARSRLPAQSCNAADTSSMRILPVDGYGMHAFCSGTSMAAPQVTGAVALIHQWWRDNDGVDPSPAMVKGLLVNSATPMRHIPNRDEGWGRVNLQALFDPATSRVHDDETVVLTAPGQAHTLNVDAVDPAQPLKVTVVWTDAPGEAGAEVALVNDLDLEVVADDGTTFLGNNLNRSFSVAGGEPDRLNNVENVFIERPAGSYRITVRAHNLPGEGVPGSGIPTSQDFALIISNAAQR